MQAKNTLQQEWQHLCGVSDLIENSGVVALIKSQQIALFYIPESENVLYAISNTDPKSGANVIGRGLACYVKQKWVVASPLYKQHFCLSTGNCLEYPEQKLPVWPVRIKNDSVEVFLAA